jgi:hypothetical protein
MVQESGSHVLSWDRLLCSGKSLESWSCREVHTVVLFLGEMCTEMGNKNGVCQKMVHRVQNLDIRMDDCIGWPNT